MNAQLKALIMMQLKDKIDLSFLSSTKKIIAKVVLSLLALAAVTGFIFLLFYVAKLLGLFSLLKTIPSSVMVVVFTVMFILSTGVCSYSLMKSFYFAKDNQVLLTLPVTTNELFTSKLIVFYIYELVKNLYFLFPLFFAYGLSVGLPFIYFIWLPICFVIVSALPVAIGSLLSIVFMLVALFLRNVPIMNVFAFLVLVGLGVWIVVKLIGLIPADLDIIGSWSYLFWDIQDFLKSFTITFYPFTMIVEMIVGTTSGLASVIFTGTTFLVLLCVLATIALCIGLAFAISKPIFCKMAAKPFEYKKKIINKTKKNRVHNKFLSMINIENKVLTRTSEDTYSLLGVFVCMPILILLLNSLYAAMSTRLLGDVMIICFNLMMIMLIALASNNKIASIFSREGSSSYLIKTRPVNYLKSLFAKLILNAVMIVLAIMISVGVFKGFNAMPIHDTIFMGLTIIFVYLSHMLWSAEMDVMNPQYAQYATTGNHVSNPNETKSTIAMFFLVALFFGISLFLSMENATTSWIKVVIIALLFMIYRIWSFCSKVKYFYKDK